MQAVRRQQKERETMMSDQSLVGFWRLSPSWTWLAIGLTCYCFIQAQQASAILNCFTPKTMFNKLGKGGHQVPYPGGIGPERAHWYPQQYPNQYIAGVPMSYQPSMKSLLFQPKWPKGGSLLGNKNWGSWKMPGATNSNFYRPGFGYGYGYSSGGGGFGGGSYSPMAYAPAGHHYNLGANYGYSPASMVVGYPTGATTTTGSMGGYSPILNLGGGGGSTYSSSGSSGGGGANDGWTVPAQHQISPIQYDSPLGYTTQQQPSSIGSRHPTIDPYGSVKGGGSGRLGTTKKGNILIADGGYSAYDAHLVDPFNYALPNRHNQTSSFGYSYPDSYSGVVESPAKIAQQLMKYGLKQQRLQQQARLAPLLLAAPNGSLARLTTSLGEQPRFVGFGVVDVLNNREARLSCSFNEPIDQTTSLPVWVKFLGPYNSTQMSGSNIVPPFDCPSIQCRTQEIDANRETRYRFDNGPATSTLIISEPRTSDYGVYRCSALSKSSSNSNLSLNTIYKIVQLGDSV